MTAPDVPSAPSDRQPAWELLEQTLSAIWALTAREVREELERQRTPPRLRNYAESGHEVLSTSTIDPYSNPTRLLAELTELEEGGWLEEVGNGSYRLNDRALRNVRTALDAADARLEALQVLPRVVIEELASILSRLADAGTIRTGVTIRPVDETRSPIGRIRGSIMALSAQRDDAHRAAWASLGVSGQTWNALTLIWHGEARNAVEVAALQSWRGYSANDYAAAIQDLVQRGWLEPDQVPGRYRTTNAGAALRDAAEARTDEQFYRAWSVLPDTEREALASRLSSLSEKLREVRRAEREATNRLAPSI